MSFYLVPIDSGWSADARLRDVLVGNLRARIGEQVQSLQKMQETAQGAESIKVFDAGNAVVVEIRDRKAIAQEKGVEPHQMTRHEGTTVPIETPHGTIFRKVTSLSLMMGKWRNRGFEARSRVKGAVDTAMSQTHDVLMDVKSQMTPQKPPLIRDILGVR